MLNPLMTVWRWKTAQALILIIMGLSLARSESITLSNGDIELTIDPEKGLILGFNRPGEANLIWVNPNPVSDPNRLGGWVNRGGDKLWWGPMIDWRSVTGRVFPPDEALSGKWTLTGRSEDKVRISSGLSPWVGIRAEREIFLSSDPSEVEIVNRFTRMTPSPHRLQLWTVCQMPIAEWCLLDSHPREGEPLYVNLRANQFDPRPYTKVLPELNAVRFDPKENNRNMIGTRGAWIAAVYQKHIVVHLIEQPADAEFPRKVSLQLYNSLEYIELETLSGVETPSVGESMSHLVRWRLLNRPEGLAEDELAAWIVNQMLSIASPLE